MSAATQAPGSSSNTGDIVKVTHFLTLFRQLSVVPAAELVQLIPLALTMTDHNNLILGHLGVLCGGVGI